MSIAFHKRTRPSALGMSDPVMEFLEILETQEFPNIFKILKGTEGTKGPFVEGSKEDEGGECGKY